MELNRMRNMELNRNLL